MSEGELRHHGPSIDEIYACSDLEQLRAWFSAVDTREIEQRAFLDSWRTAGIVDDVWYRRNAGSLAYCQISRRHLERRILGLGSVPPYSPTDPRSRQLRMQAEKIEKLEKRLRQLEPAAEAVE